MNHWKPIAGLLFGIGLVFLVACQEEEPLKPVPGRVRRQTRGIITPLGGPNPRPYRMHRSELDERLEAVKGRVPNAGNLLEIRQ